MSSVIISYRPPLVLNRTLAISFQHWRAGRVVSGTWMFIAALVFAGIAIALPLAFTLFGIRLRR
ncbi:hypothetical protein [uncultured Phenylobacterium sp.]|uniref:hypothetical protein n=1 Tax=uncultured Phenylobacterium sp. TaxID=349273 RepID=UPI0025E37BDA|nr:hypothetical protein [uncultured Phenylobacterium sp.]